MEHGAQMHRVIGKIDGFVLNAALRRGQRWQALQYRERSLEEGQFHWALVLQTWSTGCQQLRQRIDDSADGLKRGQDARADRLRVATGSEGGLATADDQIA